MQRTLNLQTHTDTPKTKPVTQHAFQNSHASPSRETVSDLKHPIKEDAAIDSHEDMTRDWISAINTSILTTLSPAAQRHSQSRSADRTTDLSRVMQSPEFASILVGAKHLADTQGITMEEATDRLIRSFREMDDIWRQIVIERGLKAIID